MKLNLNMFQQQYNIILYYIFNIMEYHSEVNTNKTLSEGTCLMWGQNTPEHCTESIVTAISHLLICKTREKKLFYLPARKLI